LCSRRALLSSSLCAGLDCHIIQEIGLNRSVDRALIGFMGCAAAMNGFRVGMDYVKSHEKVTPR
jgi:alpha-pyrone synthase